MGTAGNGRDWVWFGGRPSVDLINTKWDRKGRGIERIDSPEALISWLGEAGLLADGITADLADVEHAQTLREAISGIVDSVRESRPVDAQALDSLNVWVKERYQPPRLVVYPGLRLVSERDHAVDAALTTIVLDAFDLVTSADRSRVKVCASGTCGFRFVDQSQTGGRQWCSMSLCGNREKARLSRSRARTQRGAPS